MIRWLVLGLKLNILSGLGKKKEPMNINGNLENYLEEKQQPQMIHGAAVPLFSLLLPTNPARRIINLTALNCFKRKKMPTEIIAEPLKEVPKEGIIW